MVSPIQTLYKCSVFTDMNSFSNRVKSNPIKTINDLFKIREVIVKNLGAGELVSHIGDSSFLLFNNRNEAMDFVRKVSHEAPEKINFGIACGEIYYVGGEYIGVSVNLAARLGEDIAKDGEILDDIGTTYK